MILKTTAEQALSAALKTGGDFAELFCEDRRSGAMGLVDSRVESARETVYRDFWKSISDESFDFLRELLDKI